MIPLPARPGPSGMSDSCWFERLVGLVRLDGGDDGLDRNASVRDELAAGAAHGRGERRRPDVLVDEDTGDAARLHGGSEVLDVLFGKRLDELRLESLQLAQLVEVAELLS